MFFSALPMTFLKNKKICYSDIMGQTWYSYNAKITNSNCLVKNSYSIQLAKSIEKFWSVDKWNYLLSMESVHMHCVSLSIYLPIHLSIYISLSRYVCIYIFIYHSIYLSLYMIIIKRYCFQIEQLKLWQKQNILYFENDIILWWIYILIDISLWHQKFT